jgi:lipopolysaccharide export system permease protein
MTKNKLGYYFVKEFLKNYLSLLFVFSLIIWITQSVKLLSLIGEQGNSVLTYFIYIFLILPKFFSKLSLIIFFFSLISTINKLDDSNELKILWLSGLKKKTFIKYIIKTSFILILILILIRTFLIPYFNHLSRNLLINSGVGSIAPLIKENNFNNPLKNLTIYVGKKNKLNEIEDIILFESTAETKKTIVAKSGVIITEDNKNLIVLLNGSIQEEKAGKNISILDFDKTTIDMSQYGKKVDQFYKYSEIQMPSLIKIVLNKDKNERLDALSEINDRLITPLFIPSIIVLSFFLIITNKEKVNFFILRGLIFILGISTVIFADILVDFSSKNIKANIFLYIVPFLLFLINLFFLNRLLKNENIKK